MLPTSDRASTPRVALNAVPPHIDLSAVSDFLRKIPGVEDIHDLPIWGMSTTESTLTMHRVMPGLSRTGRRVRLCDVNATRLSGFRARYQAAPLDGTFVPDGIVFAPS